MNAANNNNNQNKPSSSQTNVDHNCKDVKSDNHSEKKTEDDFISPSQRKRSLNLAIASSLGAVIGAGFLRGPVLNLLALKLGASDVLLGWLSFAAAAPFFMGIFTMARMEKVGKKKVIVPWFMLASLIAVFFVIVPLLRMWNLLEPRYCLYIILVATLFRSMTTAFGATGWFPILQDLVPKEIVGSWFAKIRTCWQSFSLITLLVVAWFMGQDSPWWKFVVVFGFSIVALFFRAVTVMPMSEKPVKPKADSNRGAFRRVADAWKLKSLRDVMLYVCIYCMAAWAPLPFQIKYMKVLGFGDNFVLAAFAMINLGAIISLLFWGKLADRFGNRSVFSISHVGMIVTLAMWVLVDNNPFGRVLIFILFTLYSLFNSGNGIARTRYLFHAVPETRQNDINIAFFFTQLAMAVGPVMAGFLLFLLGDYTFTSGGVDLNKYHILFLINAAAFAIPHIMRRKMRFKADKPTTQVINTLARPFRNILEPFAPLKGNGKHSQK